MIRRPAREADSASASASTALCPARPIGVTSTNRSTPPKTGTRTVRPSPEMPPATTSSSGSIMPQPPWGPSATPRVTEPTTEPVTEPMPRSSWSRKPTSVASGSTSGGREVGEEFLVNSLVTGDQIDPDVAIDDAGNFVVVWSGDGETVNDGSGVFAQRFDADANPLGGQFPRQRLHGKPPGRAGRGDERQQRQLRGHLDQLRPGREPRRRLRPTVQRHRLGPNRATSASTPRPRAPSAVPT